MSSVRINVLTDTNNPRLSAVAVLFARMHAEMHAQGMRLELVPGGEHAWVAEAARSAERFGRLTVALVGDEVVGFAHGAMKLAPEHLGGMRIGHITHVYVLAEHRRRSIASQLVGSLQEWFRQKEVHSVELQVVHGAAAALSFWEGMGFRVELFQLRDR
jgi:ribosomal protein S18 acetylase RimI-like enzyme